MNELPKKLFAGIFVTVVLAASGSASAAVALCSSLTTVGAWAAAGSCVDTDGDTTFTFGSVSGTFALGTGLSITELDSGGGFEFQNVGYDFSNSGYAGGGSITYAVSMLGGLRVFGASFDTLQFGGGTSATKVLSDIGGPAFLTLTSTNGSHDPVSGGVTGFAARAAFQVVDTFATSTTGVFLHSDNAFINSVPEPETYAMLLAGLGLLGFVARRRKQKAA